MATKTQTQTSRLHLKIKELAECLDEPALHDLWPQVWLLEDRAAAQAYIDERLDQKIKLHLQIAPVVIARDLAIKYQVSSTRIGRLLTELGYRQQLLYVDGAQHRCWVRSGTEYPRVELSNYLRGAS